MFYKYNKKTKEFSGVASDLEYVNENESYTNEEIPNIKPDEGKLIYNNGWEIIKPKKVKVWLKGDPTYSEEVLEEDIKEWHTTIEPPKIDKPLKFNKDKNKWEINYNLIKQNKIRNLKNKKNEKYNKLSYIKFLGYTYPSQKIQEQLQSLLLLDKDEFEIALFDKNGNKKFKKVSRDDIDKIVKSIVAKRYDIEMEYLKEKEELKNEETD